jgi:hypothetical protein
MMLKQIHSGINAGIHLGMISRGLLFIGFVQDLAELLDLSLEV